MKIYRIIIIHNKIGKVIKFKKPKKHSKIKI